MTVTFEQAKQLKELGFDIDCRAYYMFDKNNPNKEDSLIHGRDFKNWNILDHLNTIVGYASAPSVSDALEWIRSNREIHCGVYPVVKELKDHENPIGIFYEYRIIDYKRCPTVKMNELYSIIAIYPNHPEAEIALLNQVLTYLNKKKSHE